MTEVRYRCTNPKCEAEDLDRGVLPNPPKALSCYACGAGRGLNLEQQMQNGVGMFPVQMLEIAKQVRGIKAEQAREALSGDHQMRPI